MSIYLVTKFCDYLIKIKIAKFKKKKEEKYEIQPILNAFVFNAKSKEYLILEKIALLCSNLFQNNFNINIFESLIRFATFFKKKIRRKNYSKKEKKIKLLYTQFKKKKINEIKWKIIGQKKECERIKFKIYRHIFLLNDKHFQFKNSIKNENGALTHKQNLRFKTKNKTKKK